MRLAAVITDLDGTLLEPDGNLGAEARAALHRLAAQSIPVCPVTSKTVPELVAFAASVPAPAPAGFENGAGIVLPGGEARLASQAVPVAELRAVLERLRGTTGAPARSIEELDDDELERMTGLTGASLPRARERRATLPLRVDPAWDERLCAALGEDSPVRLVRGNRFLHLQGRHDKADVVPALLAQVAPGGGTIVGCGDAPNDLGLLRRCDIAIIVPGAGGPHPELSRWLPRALVAPHPHGRGWAAALEQLLTDQNPGTRP